MKSNALFAAFGGISILAGVLAISGCLSVSAPESVSVRYGSSEHPKQSDSRTTYEKKRKISKDEAFAVAKDKALNKGANLAEYDIRDKKIRRSYWFLFERRGPVDGDGWKNHFAVRVSMFGWSRLYRKPAARFDEWKGRRIGKKEAYDIARDIVTREGADWKGYEIHDQEIHGDYWVVFETSWYQKKAGWKNYFAVRVARDGRAEWYR
ncbi:MAG: hypothetical protein JW849_03490 [Phycisphaerae bacterium]|nr:hypothetical protein [Phycisphaerae bacterium]